MAETRLSVLASHPEDYRALGKAAMAPEPVVKLEAGRLVASAGRYRVEAFDFQGNATLVLVDG